MAPPGRRAFGQRRGGGFGLLLLGAQIFQIGTDKIPPVTLATVLLNVAIYLKLIPNLPSVHGACTSNQLVLQKKQWLRMIYSSFYHLDDMHLYFNMVSFIWKGITLEKQLKSRKFLMLIAVFSVLTQLTMLLMNHMFYEIFSNPQYLNVCAAGFSAVCFALKVVTTANSNNNVSVMGMPILVPSRYACWVELILIQILVPNASFTGHLAGILVGLMYTHGPLSKIINTMDGIFSDHGHRFSFQQRNTTGSRSSSQNRNAGSFQDDDEQLQEAIRESLRHSNSPQENTRQPPSYGWNIPTGYPQAPSNNLYPDLPEMDKSHERSSPSAPPYDSSEAHPYSYNPQYPTQEKNSPLYPTSTSNYLPYPTHDISSRVPMHTSNRNEATDRYSEPTTISSVNMSEEEIRKARLRRFDKS